METTLASAAPAAAPLPATPPPPLAEDDLRPAPVVLAGDGTVLALDDDQWDDLNERLAATVTQDDTPVDNLFSELQMRLLTAPLKENWRNAVTGQTFFVAANVGLFSRLGLPPIVPDAMLALDVAAPPRLHPRLHPKAGQSYFVGLSYRKPPDVVIEIVSNRVGGELDPKLGRYDRYGVSAYVVYDPVRHLGADLVRVARRGATGRLTFGPPPPTPEDGAPVFLLPDVNLGLRLWAGEFEDAPALWWLRWCQADGTLIPTSAERAAQERQRADDARERVDQERQRADQEQQRAERLAARLRELGADPEAA